MGVYLYARISNEPISPERACHIMWMYDGSFLKPENLVAYNQMTQSNEEEVYSQPWVWSAAKIAWCAGFNVITVCKISSRTDPEILNFLERYMGVGMPGVLPQYAVEEFSKKFCGGIKLHSVYMG